MNSRLIAVQQFLKESGMCNVEWLQSCLSNTSVGGRDKGGWQDIMAYVTGNKSMQGACCRPHTMSLFYAR